LPKEEERKEVQDIIIKSSKSPEEDKKENDSPVINEPENETSNIEVVEDKSTVNNKPAQEPVQYSENRTTSSSAESGIKKVIQSIKSEEKARTADLGLKEALIIGQAFNTYIILQKGEELYLVDQHAAHERIIYESIKDKYKSNNSPVQMLVVPQVIELSGSEYRMALENENFFKNLGFILEAFGNNSLIVRSVPAVLTDTNYIQSFKDILDNISTNNSSDINLIADEAIYQIACKAAIKANKKLDERETRELLKRMEDLENPYTCPHGRPTVLRLTKYEVEKMFKRAGAD
jgi:DNA mismatch repair protein MutL